MCLMAADEPVRPRDARYVHSTPRGADSSPVKKHSNGSQQYLVIMSHTTYKTNIGYMCLCYCELYCSDHLLEIGIELVSKIMCLI